MIAKKQPTKHESLPRYTRKDIREGMYLCGGDGEVRQITELNPGRFSTVTYRVIEHAKQPRNVGKVETCSISMFCKWAMFEAMDLYKGAK